jgi:hypothetical protein
LNWSAFKLLDLTLLFFPFIDPFKGGVRKSHPRRFFMIEWRFFLSRKNQVFFNKKLKFVQKTDNFFIGKNEINIFIDRWWVTEIVMFLFRILQYLEECILKSMNIVPIPYWLCTNYMSWIISSRYQYQALKIIYRWFSLKSTILYIDLS